MLAIFYDNPQGEPISAPDNLYEILDDSIKNMTPIIVVGCSVRNEGLGRIDYNYADFISKDSEDCISFFIGSVVAYCYSDGRIELNIID